MAKSNKSLFDSAAAEKGIKIINEVDENLVVYADSNTINTVIRNLVSNSLKFTKEGGSITIGAENAGPDSATIYIRDTGVGMSPEIMQKLFRLDENVTTPGTNNEKGTGLGLILCKDFVENNGGKMNVESKIGEGSKFFFSLPLAKPLVE